MEGIIVNYRRSRRRARTNQMILEISSIDSRKKASPLLGCKVFWKSPSGKLLYGKIIGLHGNRGAVRARFKKGLPSQAIGSKIELVEKIKEKPEIKALICPSCRKSYKSEAFYKKHLEKCKSE